MTFTKSVLNPMRLFAWPACALLALSTVRSSDLNAQSTARPAQTRVAVESVRLLTKEGPVDLFGPAGVRHLASGSVLFADRKPVTVRVSDPTSGVVRQTARAGAGPGEFRSAPDFVGFSGDSVAAYDAMLRRWTILSPSGAYVRSLAATDPIVADKQSAVRIYHRAMVFNASLAVGSSPSASAIRAVVKAMPSTVGAIVVRQFEHGDLWAADSFDARQWSVFDRTGAPLSTIVFDRAVRVTSVREGSVLGVSVDDDEIPVIVRGSVRELSRAARRQTSSEAVATQTGSSDARARLSSFLQSMVVRQEQAYVDGASYTTSVAKLGVPVPPTFEVRIVQATDRGWFAVGTDKSSAVTCAIGVGYAVIGWDEGKAVCSAK